MRTLAFPVACLALVAWTASSTPAGAVPNLLQYQGRLTDAAGGPITGSHSFGIPATGPALVTAAVNTTLGGVDVVTFAPLGTIAVPTSAEGEVRTSSATREPGR